MYLNEKATSTIDNVLLEKIGLTYEEYMNLDIEEQEKIITNNNLKYDEREFIDGVPIGITTNDIKNYLIRIVNNKPLAFIKKLSRRK